MTKLKRIFKFRFYTDNISHLTEVQAYNLQAEIYIKYKIWIKIEHIEISHKVIE